MTDGEIPEAFALRSKAGLRWGLAAAATVQMGMAIAVNRSVRSLIISLLWVAIVWITFTWRARISPHGVTYTNPLGMDWSHAWSDLEAVQVNTTGFFKPLILARGPDGRRLKINKGETSTPDGTEVHTATAYPLIAMWAAAGAPPEV